MRHNRPLALLLIVCSFFLVKADCYADLSFNVNLDTSPLIMNPAGPFSLDFQLIDGSGTGDANNTATIDTFLFGTGNVISSPLTSIGGASGSLSSSVSITDSAFLNEFSQPLNPGSKLSFRVELTTNVDAGPAPDAFSFSILNNNGAEIPTTGVGSALLLVNIDSTHPRVETFGTTANSAISLSAPQVTVVPETSNLLLVGFTAVSLMGFKWLWRKRCPAKESAKGQLGATSLSIRLNASEL
jgi:hypothetical protein